MAPKRELVMTAGAGRGAAKRLRLAVSGGGSGGGGSPSPGTRLLRQTVLVMLFLLRMKITVGESISQIGRMVQKFHKVQTVIMSKLESLEEHIGKLTGAMEGIRHEVKQLACLHSNRHADQRPRLELNQECAAATGPNANIHLRFLNGLKTPIYTEKNITAESNAAIRIGIFEGDNMITGGPLSKVKVEILVLRGDFSNDGQVSWTKEEFNNHIAQGRDGQGFVLGGDCSVWLNNGEASFGRIRFKEGSSRTPNRKFVVGARVCLTEKTSVRVQEAVMKPVTVLDRRNEANEKRHPPKLDDEVYRLEEISKDGAYHKRLQKAQIFTVQDFLKALNKDAHKLREEVLQMKKVNSSWEKMDKHARECYLRDNHELIAYYSEEANVALFFNCVYDLVGAEFVTGYITRNNFDPAKEALANELKERAHDKLDSTPFNYVMNGNLPVPVPSSTHSAAGTSILVPDASQINPTYHLVAPQGTAASKNRWHDSINHSTESFYQNANFSSNSSIHGDQNIVSTHYYQGTGEGIRPLGQQQPSTSAASSWQQNPRPINFPYGTNQWDFDTQDCCFGGFPEMNNHSQMQAPLPINGGGASEASTSAQHNLPPQQFPPPCNESMLGIGYSDDLPNPVAEPWTWRDDHIPEPEPSTSAFPASDCGNI